MRDDTQATETMISSKGETFRKLLTWRLLAGFWLLVTGLIAVTAGTLAYLGPLNKKVEPSTELEMDSHDVVHPLVTASPPLLPPAPPSRVTTLPSLGATRTANEITPPDPALLEPSALYAGGFLPRIDGDQRNPMQVYATTFNTTDPRPRIAILMAGIGMNEAESQTAIALLPPAVSLAVTPYAVRLDKVLGTARSHGHELLLSIPMEPQGYPLNDTGNQSLLTGATLATNAQRLEWAMTRFAGYVGATGALGELRGERFAAAADQMAPLLETLARRGLLYVDPRPTVFRSMDQPARQGSTRGVDLVLDDPPGAAELDRRLARLEQVARDRGSALGFIGKPSPVSVDRIAAWAVGLAGRGLALAPVSVVVQMPQPPPPSVRMNSLQ